jgi:hypothetical protein
MATKVEHPGASTAANLHGHMPRPIAPGASNEWGFDASMAISPREWRNWQNVSSQGYGGPEHQAYSKAMGEALDVPSIPEKYVQTLGIFPEDMHVYFPDYKGGDLTMRQFLAAAPDIIARQKFNDAMTAPDDASREQSLKEWGSLNASDRGHLVGQAYASLTGQEHDRENPLTRQIVGSALSAVQSGTPGGQFEDAPEWAQSEFEQLKAKHGEKANQMLPPGGENNHRRLAVYELASALQDGEHAPKGVTTTQAIGSGLFAAFDVPGLGGPSDRFNNLMDPSAPRGRMNMALERWAGTGDVVRSSQLTPEKRAAMGGPAKVNGEEFEVYNPRTWDGTIAQATNASFPAGRNLYTPWNSVIGDLGTAASLVPVAGGVRKPIQFLQETADANNRIAPIRPDNQTSQAFARSRGWTKDWDSAKGGWLSANVGPAMMEVQGRRRQYLPGVADAALNTPQAIVSNPYELAATIGFAAPGATTGGRFARGLGAQVLDEASENITQGPALQGLLSGDPRGALEGAFKPPRTNPYLFQRENGSDVQASDADYWQQLDRSKAEWDRRNKQRYQEWDSSR